MTKIHAIVLADDEISIDYEGGHSLYLSSEGADLDDFIAFITILHPEFTINHLAVEDALLLQQALYHELQRESRKTFTKVFTRFVEGLQRFG